ncbi:MAG: STT3 domain-containing protein, partial [archaeon]
MEEKEGKKFFGIGKREAFVILLIFLLAFGIRMHLAKFEYFFEFDPYWDARISSYVLQGQPLPKVDPMAYYQLGGADIPRGNVAFLLTGPALYKLFTLGAAYDKLLWIEALKIIPALFGALAALGVYLFMRQWLGKKAGLLGGFFAAVTPAFVYRTMGGWYEGASLVFLPMVIGFYFAVKGIKEPELNWKKIAYIILGGAFLGSMAYIAGWFLIVPLVLAAYFAVTSILMAAFGFGAKKTKAFAALAIILLAITSVVIISNQGFGWTNSAVNYITKYVPGAATPAGGTTAGQVLSGSVGEQNTGWQFFGSKYNALLIFPFMALILLPWRFFRKKDLPSMLFFFWVLGTLGMAWLRLQLTFAFGLAVAFSAGYVCFEILEFFSHRKIWQKRAGAAFVLFFMVLGVGAGSYFMLQNTPNIELANGWKDGMQWLRESTPKDAKLFNWWDEGHWLSFIGERKVSTDNRNYDFNANSDYAKLVVAEDENSAYKIAQKYGADYLVLGSDMVEKQGSMAIYAFVTKSSDPRTQRYLGAVFFCSKQTAQVTGQVTYNCGPNAIPESQMNSLPVDWTAAPNQFQADSSGQLRMPLFVYRTKDYGQIMILNAASNSTMAAKLWTNDASIKHFKLGFEAPGLR